MDTAAFFGKLVKQLITKPWGKTFLAHSEELLITALDTDKYIAFVTSISF